MEIRCPQTPSEWEDYYDLRYRVLREPLGKPRGSERNEGDETGTHFALFKEGKIQAIARLDQIETHLAQVRFVAVENDLQGTGLGLAIMQEVERYAKKVGISEIILHARDYALKFYEKQNYALIGSSYKLFDVLQHYEMRKKLD